MTDEKFTFIEDVREKKRTATGAHHKRTHCGKGGAIRFPSDFMTKKELRAMNGEVKEYRLNDPMSWKEFKAMPDDIKIIYIKALRQKYNVSDTKIMEMLGVSGFTFCKEVKRLGIGAGHRSGRTKWDEDGWYAWVNGVPVKTEDEAVTFTQGKCFEFEVDDVAAVTEKCDEEVLEQAEKCDCTADRAIPGWGQMELEGTVEECAKTLEMLLTDKRVKLAVSWTVVE